MFYLSHVCSIMFYVILNMAAVRPILFYMHNFYIDLDLTNYFKKLPPASKESVRPI